jgi:hypothetical protein
MCSKPNVGLLYFIVTAVCVLQGFNFYFYARTGAAAVAYDCQHVQPCCWCWIGLDKRPFWLSAFSKDVCVTNTA